MGSIIVQSAEQRKQGIRIEVDSAARPLGEGNFGIVRRGVLINQQTGERRDVAVKFLYDDLSRNAIVRAEKEASICIHHENLVEMIGFVRTEAEDGSGRVCEHYHVVSELLNGVMLYDLLAGTVTDTDGNEIMLAKKLYSMLQTDRNAFALEISKSIVYGINALHSHGYIHRDIDPSNIMITSDGRIKLIDLGIAKSITPTNDNGPHLTSTGDFVGKAAYAAPELVRGDIQHQDVTTDIYAIGIMIYQLATGTLPFNGAVNNILRQQINDDVPVSNIKNSKLRTIVKKATQKNQVDRYQSAQELMDALEGNVSEEVTSSIAGIVIGAATVAGIALGVVLGLFL